MNNSAFNKKINGISVCNPVDVDKDYLLYTVDYAIREGFNHIQYIGPTHDGVKGNIDGMTFFRKYASFNSTKDAAYVEKSIDAVNEACNRAYEHGIDMYLWHHELDLPLNFKEVYPEVQNSYGDIEVTHPIIKDFLENRVMDFFHTYPKMKGIVLTLHETKIPLLKLKEQKLDKVERVKYITEILYNACKNLGKELIVRPFASLEEDYELMTRAYESISDNLVIMDKWTQFDWSLTLPHNSFFKKIKKNPIMIETDIFGEYFGKGRLPLMLKNHIKDKYKYCETFNPVGYDSRIDRHGSHPFGDVNEVNINIMNACVKNEDVDKAIDNFFAQKYPEAPDKVRELMEKTEEIQIKIMNLCGYYFSQMSLFPTLNHCKNHYYFEIMKNECTLVSDEWYIPKEWKKTELKKLVEEKETAVSETTALLEKLILLKGVISETEYKKLWVKFSNLKYVAEVWLYLMLIIANYTRYFETREDKYFTSMKHDIENILALNNAAKEELGEDFYCVKGNGSIRSEFVETFVHEVLQSFEIEKNTVKKIESDASVKDYIVCGGGNEGHYLQKEVNFSDTLVIDDCLCRIPGSIRGMNWCSINAHGWFSYMIKVTPKKENTIKILVGNPDETIDVKITVGTQEFEFHEKVKGKKELVITYVPEKDEDSVKIRFDKISPNTPCIYTVTVL